MEKKRLKGALSLITVLLGFACVATTISYLILKGYSDRDYRRRWKDYNDCGLA